MYFATLLAALALTGVLPIVTEHPQATPTKCELHIWPAAQLSGLAFRLGVIRGRATEGQIVGAMDDLLSPEAQLAALREVDFSRELRVPADTVRIEHAEPLDAKTANKIKTRRSDSTSNCYYELIMVEHYLTEDIVWGDRFGSIFIFRSFGDKAVAQQSQKGTGGNKLKVFTQAESARTADTPQIVAAAVRGNFLEYAKNARGRMPAVSPAKR